MLHKNLAISRETVLMVDGQKVVFEEYEPQPEGDFLKVRTNDRGLGVGAEYAWFENKYPGATCQGQELIKINLNGKKIYCDILTIELPDGQTKKIYFDISQLM